MLFYKLNTDVDMIILYVTNWLQLAVHMHSVHVYLSKQSACKCY